MLNKKSSLTKKVLKGGARSPYAESILSMIASSYASIGIPASRTSQLLIYDVWWVYFNSEGTPSMFTLFKKTAFGYKSGLSGTDGSSEARSAVMNLIATKFKTKGFYGEVSHKVEAIALASGTPKIPAKYAEYILINKKVIPEEDGFHYKRILKLEEGDKSVVKILVGMPNINFKELDQKLEKQGSLYLRKSSVIKLANISCTSDAVAQDMHQFCLDF